MLLFSSPPFDVCNWWSITTPHLKSYYGHFLLLLLFFIPESHLKPGCGWSWWPYYPSSPLKKEEVTPNICAGEQRKVCSALSSFVSSNWISVVWSLVPVLNYCPVRGLLYLNVSQCLVLAVGVVFVYCWLKTNQLSSFAASWLKPLK